MSGRRVLAWNLVAGVMFGCAPPQNTDAAGSGVASAQLAADPVAAVEPHPEPEPEASSGERAAKTATASPGDHARCDRLCVPTGELECGPVDVCVAACHEMMAEGPCGTEFRGFVDCATAEPVAHWECSDGNTAAIREGYCHGSQAAFFACIRMQMTR